MNNSEEYRILRLLKKSLAGSGGGNLKTVTLTQDEYDALVDAGTVDNSTFYMIVDEDGE